MTGAVRKVLLRVARVMSLGLLAVVGTIVLVRLAPGYFSNAEELDAQHSALAQAQTLEQQQAEGGLAQYVWHELRGWAHGDLGRSRHFDVPVAGLVRERALATAKLLLTGVLCGWLGALALALPLGLARGRAGAAVVAAPIALLLAVPVAALATVCLLANFGGPALVLSLLVGARDFQLVHRLLRHVLRGQQFLYARAQGVSTAALLRRHLLPAIAPELLALAMTSFVLALSAAVPVEVIFDVPGLGQLAWSAAQNRDLPVLLAVTLLMAGSVGVASLFASAGEAAEVAQCA